MPNYHRCDYESQEVFGLAPLTLKTRLLPGTCIWMRSFGAAGKLLKSAVFHVDFIADLDKSLTPLSQSPKLTPVAFSEAMCWIWLLVGSLKKSRFLVDFAQAVVL